MKCLVFSLILTTLAGCGESSKSANKGSQYQRYLEGLKNVPRGQTRFESTVGSEFTFIEDSLKRETIKRKSFSTILKIEGKKKYIYEEVTDLKTGEISKEVSIDESDIEQDLKEIIKSGAGRVSGSTLYLNQSEAFAESWSEGVSLSFQLILNGTFNLAKPLCESVLSVDQKNIKIVVNGRTQRIGNVSQKTTATCGKILSAEELKAIDLTSVMFCEVEPESENEVCAQQDMGHLTADL